MKEIQERPEAYLLHCWPAVWRNGRLVIADYNFGVLKASGYHDSFMAGEIFAFDPLTSEFVRPPKPERPYDMTNGQVLDALQKDPTKRFEGDVNEGATACMVGETCVVEGASRDLWPIGGSLKACRWREIIEE